MDSSVRPAAYSKQNWIWHVFINKITVLWMEKCITFGILPKCTGWLGRLAENYQMPFSLLLNTQPPTTSQKAPNSKFTYCFWRLWSYILLSQLPGSSSFRGYYSEWTDLSCKCVQLQFWCTGLCILNHSSYVWVYGQVSRQNFHTNTVSIHCDQKVQNSTDCSPYT